MTGGLTAYAEIKDSGVDWLGKVPAHWQLVPNKTLLRRRKVLVGAHHANYRLLSLTKRGVVIRDVSTARGKFSSDMSTFQEVRAGDLVFCLFDVPETPRTVGLSAHFGMITGAYDIFECEDPLVARYLEALYIAIDDSKLLQPLYSGLRNTIPTPRFLGAKAPLPPKTEQAAIVRFLNYMIRRIQKYIRAKEKLIALLEEYKQALVHQAVTGQIDVRTGQPYPTYKDSGVEWLAEIPSHWEMWRSKRVFRRRTELARPADAQLSATQAYGVIAQADYEKRIGRKVTKILRHLDKRRHVEVDDFVISMRSFQGGLERAWESGCIRSSYIVLRPATRLIVGYFGHLFKSSGYIAALQSTANFIRDGQDLNFENFCNVDLPFPPLEEQKHIAEALARTTDDVRARIKTSRRQIVSLREYRARLIADVVTGKLDVREAAAELPDTNLIAWEHGIDKIQAEAHSHRAEPSIAEEANA